MGIRNYVEELEYSDAKGLDTASPPNLVGPGFVREARNVNLGPTGGYVKRNGYTRILKENIPITGTHAIANDVITGTGTLYAQELTLGDYLVFNGLPDQKFKVLSVTNNTSCTVEPTGATLSNQTAVINNTLDGFAIVQGFEFKTSNTLLSSKLILFGKSPSTGIVGRILLGTFREFVDESSQIIELNQFNRGSFAQVNDSLYYFDGSGDSQTPFVYEDNDEYTRSLGIDSPLLDPTEASQGVGGSLNEGQYIFGYTYGFYFNNQLIAESSPKISEFLVVNPGNSSVTINLSAYPAYGAAHLSHLNIVTRIWRTVVNGSILFYETEIPANQTTYTSTTGDDGLLSEQMTFDNTKLTEHTDYDKARFPTVARNRLFVFHPSQNRGRFSKIGFNGPLPESFPATHEFSVEGKYGSSDRLIGAGQLQGIPIILKEKSIGRLEEVGLPDLGNSDDAVVFNYREISETVGAVSHHAQTQVLGELVFLGRDNIYATDGQNVRPIATQIQNLIRACDFAQNRPQLFSAINDTKNRRIYIQVFKTTSSSTPDLTLVGDYQQYPNFRWTTYESGEDKLTHPGIIAGCFFQVNNQATGGFEVYFGSGDYRGQVFRMNNSQRDDYETTDNNSGYGIAMRVVSRPYFFNTPLFTKLYKSVRLFVEVVDNSYNFEFSSIFDLNSEETSLQAFSSSQSGTFWDIEEWAPSNDPLIWSGPSLSEFKYSLHRKAKMMQLIVKQEDKDAPITLLGWGVAGSVFSGI
ncbi:hypothetical protein EBZ38_03265 [bacterium]|nr:hypothetical protein [bacterium]NDC93981.1 hypothetical protein [bacterium]NDD83286.1 hypothetical protein [bacterium]